VQLMVSMSKWGGLALLSDCLMTFGHMNGRLNEYRALQLRLSRRL
jgi:hypothetical protein